MNFSYLILTMIFFHIVDDYYLQKGLLNNLKQKSWWQENAPEKLYCYDYIVGLAVHGFSWAFMVMLPIAFIKDWDIGASFLVAFVINWFLHSFIDDLKANRHKTNLIQDQLAHIAQIIVTALLLWK